MKIADFGLSRSLAITQQNKHTGTAAIPGTSLAEVRVESNAFALCYGSRFKLTPPGGSLAGIESVAAEKECVRKL